MLVDEASSFVVLGRSALEPALSRNYAGKNHAEGAAGGVGQPPLSYPVRAAADTYEAARDEITVSTAGTTVQFEGFKTDDSGRFYSLLGKSKDAIRVCRVVFKTGKECANKTGQRLEDWDVK